MHARTIIFVLGALLGVVIGEVSWVASEVAVGAMLLSLVQVGIYFLDRRNRKQTGDTQCVTRLFSISVLTILFCVGLSVGILRIQFTEEKINFTCASACTFDARIVSSPETKDEYQIFNVHPLDDAEGKVLNVQVRTSLYPQHRIGETIKISGKAIISSVLFPHSDTKNSGRAFDYTSYLRTRNVGSEMLYPKIEVIDGEARSFRDILGRWKESLIKRMMLYVSSPASQLANGMLFGTSSLSKDIKETFRIVGLSHIIVLSGFNIAVVISFIFFVLAFLPLVVRLTCASLCVIGFVIMVGGEASVIRATIMSFLGLLAMLVGRAYVARQALILSLFAIVMYEPFSLLHDVSLHLSFLATAGIVYMNDYMTLFCTRHIPFITLKSFQELFGTTLSAYVATLPYITYTFGAVSAYTLLANIVVLPFVPVTMLISFLVVTSSYVSHPLALMFGFMDTLLIDLIIAIARMVATVPFSSFLFTVSFSTMCVAYVLLIVCMKHISRGRQNETRATYENGNLTDVISY